MKSANPSLLNTLVPVSAMTSFPRTPATPVTHTDTSIPLSPTLRPSASAWGPCRVTGNVVYAEGASHVDVLDCVLIGVVGVYATAQATVYLKGSCVR